MRLLHKTTLKYEEFVGNDIPPYGILSHTWGKDEITFIDIVKYDQGDAVQQAEVTKKLGWRKIKFMQDVLRDDNDIDYFWQDTCMIDKSSSAELSESINSMYRWYEKADSCYVYLTDVLTDTIGEETSTQFKAAKWFTRGWTLQELLAPSNVKFYNHRGLRVGTRQSLRHLISNITGIDRSLLMGYGELWNFSVATRMSWAANRETTRIEDRAYSLLGIFGVNLALIYGEGEKAFFRLQEEIMKETYDQSIFAWAIDHPLSESAEESRAMGVLARNPSFFSNSRGIVRRSGELDSHAITNKGIKIRLPIIRMPNNSLAAVLCCAFAKAGSTDFEPYSIGMIISTTAKGDGSFGRQSSMLHKLESIPDTLREHAEPYDIYLSKLDDPVFVARPRLAHNAIGGEDRFLRPLQFSQFRLKFIAPQECSNWFLHRYLTTPQPLTRLSTFSTIADPQVLHKKLCTDGIHFPSNGPDRVLAIQYAHVLHSGWGFVIMLESKQQFRNWDLSVQVCGCNDNMEMLLMQSTGMRSEKGEFHWMDNAPSDKPSYRRRLDESTWVNVQFDMFDGLSVLSVRLWDVGSKAGRRQDVFELPA